MTDMSVDALSEFRSAIEDDDPDRAFELIDPLTTELQEWSEQALVREELAYDIELSGEGTEVAESYLGVREEAREQRLEFAYAVYGLADGSSDLEDLLEPTQAMEQTVETVEEITDELESIRDDIESPPRLSLRRPSSAIEMQRNDATEIPIPLENIGGSAADSIELSIKRGVEEITIDPEQVPELESGETTMVTVSAEGLDTGEYSALVQAASETATVSTTVEIVVRDRANYVTLARRQLDELVEQTERVADAVDSGNGEGRRGNSGRGDGPLSGLVNRAQTSRDRLAEIEQKVLQGADGHDIDGKLKSVDNTLDAYKNQVEAQSEKADRGQGNGPDHELSETDATRLISEAAATQELLDKALDTR